MENKGEIDIVTLIIIATMGILLLIFFVVLFVLLHQKKMLANKSALIDSEIKHQKKLLDVSLEIAEQERMKVAANIHDDVGMMMNVLKLNLNRAHKNLTDTNLIDEILNNSYGIIDNSIETIRAISNDLMPPTLIKLGFVKGVRELCRQINLSEVIQIEFNSELEEFATDKKVEFHLYRLIKEIMNNTIKHTKASIISLEINTRQNKLIIIISHNGEGITTETIKQLAENSKGLGLKSIFSRAQLINANVQYITNTNQNPKVTIETPIL